MNYIWNYLPSFRDGQPHSQVVILLSPGDWPDFRRSLDQPQPWDEQGFHAEAHDASGWSETLLGAHLLVVSPPFAVPVFPVVDNRGAGARLLRSGDGGGEGVGGG